jgi:hypothetical protein
MHAIKINDFVFNFAQDLPTSYEITGTPVGSPMEIAAGQLVANIVYKFDNPGSDWVSLIDITPDANNDSIALVELVDAPVVLPTNTLGIEVDVRVSFKPNHGQTSTTLKLDAVEQ